MSSAEPVEILLVEDNPGDVRLTREALREARVRNSLTVAADGVEALRILRCEGEHSDGRIPDLILLDLNLPKMDGREVLDAIKGDARLRLIPVVVLTTSSADRDVLGAYELNANCYITKPVDFHQFIEVVRQIEGFWLSIVRLPPK